MNRNRIILPILFLLLFAAYYSLLKIIPADYNDIHDHAAFARQMCTGAIPYTGNFLVYLLVNLFSFFSAKVTPTEISLCGLLALAGVYRFYLSQKKITSVIEMDNRFSSNYWFIALLSLSLLFVFAIPIPSYLSDDKFMYIGNYVPTVWHNSTILFLFPFALLLFEQSYKQLRDYSGKRNIGIFLLILLNLFIKPSYFFVFVCVYPILLLSKYKLKKEFWYSIVPLVVGFFFLIGEYWIIYKTGTPSSKVVASSVVFLPFYRNPEFADLGLIPVSMLFSLLFPVLYTLINLPKLLKSQLFWYIFLSLVASVLIFFFISESGPRAAHGNFYWQIVICTWFCFFVALLSLLKDFKFEGNTFKNWFLALVFAVHVIMGILYFVKILVTGSYY
ncbi:MAG: hypothetical protein Q8904_12055 [Bacteroidota bacterium]|nr:hypothetical protein [Bacteroidota bacterium]